MKLILTILTLFFTMLQAVSQSADFSYETTSGLFCTPATVRFTQQTTGTPIGYVWKFGNNYVSNSKNPSTTYINPGRYLVTLIVIYKKNTIQISKTIEIHPSIRPSFDISRTSLCTPGNISFTAITMANINYYEWNFGDDSGIYTTTSPNINHYFSDYRSYNISFKAVSHSGCSGSSFTSIEIKKPVINPTVSRTSGCIPATVVFNAVVSVPLPSVTIRYNWNFDDGSPAITTTTSRVIHTYENIGNYHPRVDIVTNDSCRNEFSLPELTFGIPPVNLIAYPKKTIFCGSESPAFVAKADNANKYLWNFGEGDSTYTTDTVLQHKFKTLGVKNITVTPLFNDCAGSSASFQVEVIGVIASYNYSNTCLEKNRFDFTNISQGNLSTITWTFGDGTPDEFIRNVVHTYPDTGIYNTKLYVTDNITRCTDTYTKPIYTALPTLINPDSSVCKNSNTNFIIPGNYRNPSATYEWFVVGKQIGPNSNPDLSVMADILGHYNNNYVVINNGSEYCADTINLNKTILVRGPMLNYSIPPNICLGNSITVNNSSYSYIPEDRISDWRWNYGIPGSEEDSVFQPQPYMYPYWGTFPVKLTATDINGCKDSLVKPIVIYDSTFLIIIPDVDTLCQGQSKTLIAFHFDPLLWSSASGVPCADCDTITVSPNVTSTYYAKATNRYNCVTTKSIELFVYTPFTATAKDADAGICLNEKVQLDVSPKDKKISWYPVTGLSDSTLFNPFASPKESTNYTATLTDASGCFSSSTAVHVEVHPLPLVDAGPDKYYPYEAGFTMMPAYSNNIREYLWTPSGNLDCITCPNPNGMANTSRTYMIQVVSDSGCISTDKVAINVECNGANLLLPTAFSPNNDRLNDKFYPITRGIQTILSFTIYNRYGQLVFQARDFEPNRSELGWNGRWNGQEMNPDAYVYVLEARCEIGERINKKGSFMLLR